MTSEKRRSFKNEDGYIKVHEPGHPKARNGFVSEHVLVMEAHIGRPIPEGCHVHHRNQKRHDNRIENLLLMKSWEAHTTLHRALDAGHIELVAALERWSFLFMDKLRQRLPVEECMKAGEEPKPVPAAAEKKPSGSTKPKVILRKKTPKGG